MNHRDTDSQNLLFITIDCLRQDFIQNDWADTPFIADFRESGAEYQELYSTTTTTTPSVASLFTGTYSERNGVNTLLNVQLNNEVSTMAELFADAGYATAAMVAGPLVEDTGLQRGFNTFDHRSPDQNLVGGWYDTAVEGLKNLTEPFFLYVHLWEIHRPITVPSAFDKPMYGDTSYARMLSALDRSLEQFVEATPEDTVIVLHGDHGESISWRQVSLHSFLKQARDKIRYELGIDTRRLERFINRIFAPFGPEYNDHFIEQAHGETVFDFMTNVPFICNGPNINSVTVESQCRQVDILPTLLDYFNIPIPSWTDGESLLPPKSVEDRVAYIRACGAFLRGEANWQRGIRTPKYKYIEYPNRDWPPELYDLDTDKQELRNIAESHRDRVDDLQNNLPTRELMDVDSINIDAHLRDLGYL